MARSTQNRVRSGGVWRASAYGELEIPQVGVADEVTRRFPLQRTSTGLGDREGRGVVRSLSGEKAATAGMESINACFVVHARRSPYTLASKVMTRSVYGG